RVLDSQMQNAVRQLDIRSSDKKIRGKVAVIDKNSSQLAEALEEGRAIIVTTLQKFPFVVDKISQLPGQRFAIIADEAHSSQTGETSKELKRVLGVAHIEDAENPEAITGEELINASMKARGRHPNLSFFGFTATPKQKTLQLFGKPNPKDPRGFSPFDEYTMRQAIEEGFILDVLENYTTLKTYFNLLKTIEDDPNYPKSRAMRQLRNYVDMHSYTLDQKTAVIVTHFINTVQNRIPDKNGRGQANGMVVTRGRKHAVRYKLAFDRYLIAHNIPYKALVAFSGEVEDGGKFTEAGMNGFSDTQTATAFKKPEYRFLIVAEKFQTGFDEPLLHTMYIDKVLSGLAAVQTLSRLNRIRKNKSETMALDFVNEAEHIQKAFQPYYQTTLLSEGTDPNKLYDLQYALSEFDLYSDAEAAAIAELFLREGEEAEKLQPLIRAVVTRFNYIVDEAQKDEFRKFLDSYIRLYAFLAQVISFYDGDLERLYLFGRLLRKSLPRARQSPQLNVQEHADLESYRIQKQFEGQIELEKGDGLLEPMGDGLMGNGREDEKLRLSEIIAELNERFGTVFDEGDHVFFAELKTRMVNQDSLRSSTVNNSQEHVRLLFEALFPSVLQTMIENNFDLYKKITDESDFREEVIKFIFSEAYREWERGME
ncbi:MAG: type I restriction endonuclease subunit R, partial [Chloroflexi bacterium]|nr:type I restriction endonuclease subunit R [Chloroflexota bacterium]